MRGAVFYGKGDLRVEEMPRPQVVAGEVLVRISVCGCCHTDLAILEGAYPLRDVPGAIGHEYAGTVIEVGEGVTSLAVGDHVTALPLARLRPLLPVPPRPGTPLPQPGATPRGLRGVCRPARAPGLQTAAGRLRPGRLHVRTTFGLPPRGGASGGDLWRHGRGHRRRADRADDTAGRPPRRGGNGHSLRAQRLPARTGAAVRRHRAGRPAPPEPERGRARSSPRAWGRTACWRRWAWCPR